MEGVLLKKGRDITPLPWPLAASSPLRATDSHLQHLCLCTCTACRRSPRKLEAAFLCAVQHPQPQSAVSPGDQEGHRSACRDSSVGTSQGVHHAQPAHSLHRRGGGACVPPAGCVCRPAAALGGCHHGGSQPCHRRRRCSSSSSIDTLATARRQWASPHDAGRRRTLLCTCCSPLQQQLCGRRHAPAISRQPWQHAWLGATRQQVAAIWPALGPSPF